MQPARTLKMAMIGGGPDAFIGEVHRKAARLQRGKELHAVRRRTAQRLEQARPDENRHIMRLTVQHPGCLLRIEPRRQLPEQR